MQISLALPLEYSRTETPAESTRLSETWVWTAFSMGCAPPKVVAYVLDPYPVNQGLDQNASAHVIPKDGDIDARTVIFAIQGWII